ncbi:MAG: glycosyltransferase family 2 protein [Ignavibacteriales bacterium]|nr:glycosyltransferase family 2 protein [Ignavibacteriales bacterium]
MTAILIPAYNAETTLKVLLPKLLSYVKSSQIIVVDDGSSDGTFTIAKAMGVTSLRHERNKGKGAALKTGFAFVTTSTQCDAVVTLDADLQHRPEDLPAFLDARKRAEANIIIGYRARIGTAMPVSRILSNSITSALVSARTGVFIKDSQCGYRLVGREVLEAITIGSTGYEAETEFLIKAARKGFSIKFIPIQTVYNGERSYMTHWHTTKRFIQVLMKEY